MRNLKNLTITLPRDLAAWARTEADQSGISTSRFVAGLLERARRGQAYEPDGGVDLGRPLPASLRVFFWEFDFDNLRWPQDRNVVVAKILESGDWDSYRWLRSMIGMDGVRDWLCARGGRGLDRRRVRFWALVLELPKAIADAWMASLDADPWSNRLTR